SCIVHALDWLEEHEQYHPDNVVLMQCTSPIREEGTIDTAFELFFADDCDSMLTVSPFWHFLWNSPEKPAASYDFQNRPRRQDIPSQDIKYRENGSFYITKTEIYRACNNRLGGKIGMHVMSEEEGYEIDTPTDWLINEAILSNKVR
ncbi:MAG: acylneuraminate cytidylyltransferase family protein, partial [Pontibacterium sp.]